MKALKLTLALAITFIFISNTAVASVITEVEANDTLATAYNIDPFFSLGYNYAIQNSTTMPWVSINGTGNGTYDYYSFTITTAGTNGIFDIDYTHNIDTEIALWNAAGAVLAANDDSGSYDSLLEFTFAQTGTYIIGVAEYNAYATTGGWTSNSNTPDYRDSYTLQVSLSNAPDTSSNAPVPEPATLVLLGSGLLGLAGFRKNNK